MALRDARDNRVLQAQRARDPRPRKQISDALCNQCRFGRRNQDDIKRPYYCAWLEDDVMLPVVPYSKADCIRYEPPRFI